MLEKKLLKHATGNSVITLRERTKMKKIFSVVLVSCFLLCSGVHAATYEQAKATQAQNALKTSNGVAIKNAVNKYSAQYHVDPKLIHAIILTESGYNHTATSQHGASGLMQLMPTTFRARNVGTNIYSIDQNVHAGTKHFAGLMARYNGSTAYALAAYNAGGGAVRKGSPIPSYTRPYVNKVMKHYEIVKGLNI